MNNQDNNSIWNKTLYTTGSGKPITVKTIIGIIGIIIVISFTLKTAFDIGSSSGRYSAWSNY